MDLTNLMPHLTSNYVNRFCKKQYKVNLYLNVQTKVQPKNYLNKYGKRNCNLSKKANLKSLL